jgi:hypothetical protein
MQAVSERNRGEVIALTTLQKVLGGDWYRLHPAVRERFARDPEPGQPIRYTGAMETVEASFAGRLFARFTQLIGRPLAIHTGRNVPMDVTLVKRADGGVDWRRLYHFPGRRPVLVSSAKRADAGGHLCEYVGCGFGMQLNVSAREGALHFVSETYFWEVMGRQIPLPGWLSPGRAHVVHEDLGGGKFRFSLAMDHVWLGRTFYQSGVFRLSESKIQ